jgi:beta-1,4-mannosyl-glycoprotein beta-1,4-N-acetylglucosaminyltransferase
MKVIDCFMYFDEDRLLEIRLNTLYDYVEKFVIVEANLDHAGNVRKPQFNIEKFSKFKNKIQYILIKNLPTHNNFYKKNWGPSWRRENLQRDALSIGFNNCDPNDLIMISDLDEIPNPEKISKFSKNNKFGCFVQKNFLYKFNLLNENEPKWYGTRICRKKDLKSPQWLREIKTKKRPFYKFYKAKFDIFIEDGGWHFSSVKSVKDIYKKLNSYAEQQFNNGKFKDLEVIKNKINEKKDLFDRDYNYKVLNIDTSFPKYIQDNEEKLKDFIYF